MRRIALALAAAGILAAGCGSAPPAQPKRPVNTVSTPPSPWHQLDGGDSPYNFPAVAYMCNGPDGVYISSYSNEGATAGGDVFVVKDDPECAS